MNGERGKNFKVYAGLFLVSTALLMVEILSTRIAKISFGPGFHFLILSSAILGIGLGGIIVFCFYNSVKKLFFEKLSLFSFIYSLSMFLPFGVSSFKDSPSISSERILFAATLFAVFILAGIIIAFIFRYFREKISILYFLNMSGAAVGSFLIIILMNAFGNEMAILGTILVSILATLTFCEMKTLRAKVFIFVYLSIAFILFLTFPAGLEITCSNDPNSWDRSPKYPADYSCANAMSYLEIYKEEGRSYRTFIDCGGHTTAVAFDGRMDPEIKNLDVTYLPYQLRDYESVLIIGSGGGVDAVRAIMGNSKRIAAVEINPLIINKMAEIIPAHENVYNRKEVTLYTEEARSFISTHKKKYDLIYIGGTKSYGGVGVFSVNSLGNYVYTKEAFSSYLKHLNKNGILFIRDKKIFIKRYTNTLILALLSEGISPKESMAIIRHRLSGVAGIIVKNSVFSHNEKKLLNQEAEGSSFGVYYLSKSDINVAENAEYAQKSDIITDDNPFFRRHLKNDLTKGDTKWIKKIRPKNEYFYYFFYATFGMLFLFFAFPLFRRKKYKRKKLCCQLAYFSCIGLGYIIIEITFIHKFTLFLASPTNTLSIVLSSLLFFGGIGSLIADRLKGKDYTVYITRAAIILVLYSFSFIHVIDFIFERSLYMPLMGRLMLSVLTIMVPGVCMGMFFPLGLKITAEESENYIPYMLGINGIASVLGSSITQFGALQYGINAVIWEGYFFT